MLNPHNLDDDDEMTEEEYAELENQLLERGHLKSDSTLDLEKMSADCVPFDEFYEWLEETEPEKESASE
jgi:hypothetical protein